jgi:hypothetical protein
VAQIGSDVNDNSVSENIGVKNIRRAFTGSRYLKFNLMNVILLQDQLLQFLRYLYDKLAETPKFIISGTTAVAALEEGRNSYSVELSSHIFQCSLQRVQRLMKM